MNRQLIKRLRANKGMNQHQFSKFIGISRAQLAQIEAGYTAPSQIIKDKIYSAFDIEYIDKVRSLLD